MKHIATLSMSLALALSATAQSFEGAYSSEGHYVTFQNFCLLNDGGYLLAALDMNDADLNIVRTGIDGDVLWTRTYTPLPGESILGVSAVGQFSNGDAYLLVNSYGMFTSMRVLVRIALDGTLVWARGLNYSAGMIDDYDVRLARLVEYGNGDMLLSIPSMTDPVLTKLTSAGVPMWSKSYASNADSSYDKHPTFDCEPTDDGGVVVCGKDRDWPYVMRIDANGNMQLNQTYYQVYTYSHLRNMELLPNGDMLFAGMHDQSAMMMRMDASGTILWLKRYSEDYYFESMEPMDDGTLVLASQGSGSLYHMDTDGNVLSAFGPPLNTMVAGLNCFSGAGGLAHMAGGVYNMQNGMAYSYVARFSPDSPPNCMYEPRAITVTDVPAVAGTNGVATMIEQAEPVTVVPVLWEFSEGDFTRVDLCGIAESVGDLSAAEVTVTPTLVEAGEAVNLDLGAHQGASIHWIAANGALAKTDAITGTKGSLGTGTLAPGLYTLLTSTSDGAVHSTRLLVR